MAFCYKLRVESLYRDFVANSENDTPDTPILPGWLSRRCLHGYVNGNGSRGSLLEGKSLSIAQQFGALLPPRKSTRFGTRLHKRREYTIAEALRSQLQHSGSRIIAFEYRNGRHPGAAGI